VAQVYDVYPSAKREELVISAVLLYSVLSPTDLSVVSLTVDFAVGWMRGAHTSHAVPAALGAVMSSRDLVADRQEEGWC